MGLEDKEDEAPSPFGEAADKLNQDPFEDGKDGLDHASERLNDNIERFEQELRSFFLWFITAILFAAAAAFIVSTYYVFSEGTTDEGRVAFFFLSAVSCALGTVIAVKLFQSKKRG